jgi:hypothetical protein
MIRFEISEQELSSLNKERFYHPAPIFMKRYETAVFIQYLLRELFFIQRRYYRLFAKGQLRL